MARTAPSGPVCMIGLPTDSPGQPDLGVWHVRPPFAPWHCSRFGTNARVSSAHERFAAGIPIWSPFTRMRWGLFFDSTVITGRPTHCACTSHPRPSRARPYAMPRRDHPGGITWSPPWHYLSKTVGGGGWIHKQEPTAAACHGTGLLHVGALPHAAPGLEKHRQVFWTGGRSPGIADHPRALCLRLRAMAGVCHRVSHPHASERPRPSPQNSPPPRHEHKILSGCE